MISENGLSYCENGIVNLAKGLGITQKEILKIIIDGMESQSPISGQLSNTNKYFINEMRATFDVY